MEKPTLLKNWTFPLRALGGQIFIDGEGDKRFGHTCTQRRADRVIIKEIGGLHHLPAFCDYVLHRTAADETDLFLKQQCFKAIDCTSCEGRDLEKKSFASTVCQEYEGKPR